MTRTSGIIALGLAAMLAAACGSPGHDEAPPPPSAVSVQTAPATVAELAERLEAGGVVVARESAVISSRVVAPILAVRVRAGDGVRAGDVLVTLDARDVAAQARQAGAAALAAEQALAQARSAEAAAAAEYKLAAAWHARIARLHERNSATAQERDEAEARLAAAAARAAGAQAGIDQANAAMAALRAGADAAAITESFTVIRAPFDGVVTERFTDPGNLATPGSPLLVIDAGGQRRVEVRVDEARAAYVRPGDRVAVFLDSSDAGAPRETVLEGTVTEIARAVTADQRAFSVKVALPADARPRTGTFARVRFRGEPRRGVVVPPGAVRRQGQVTSVFVVQDGIARIRLVQTGGAGAEGIELTAGVDAGELVVIARPPGLVDGHPVISAAAAAPTGGRP
jgi:RND family efflux transporter MFP subunit